MLHQSRFLLKRKKVDVYLSAIHALIIMSHIFVFMIKKLTSISKKKMNLFSDPLLDQLGLTYRRA